ncbi:PAS domain S-box-containing protein [Arenibacter nanhaiticus]|uniref:histidine kinase n=1 Tax=Arenibacter nanhaiticus TaxID=558155 RepID=A0A1M6LZJ7_9FLAO|nr:PAS domain S-box protein [Arenibacter nanhaiticus]SHJ76656.1 PAS domain S-box-containing protein [Arenibacter nanhaiticus]
MKKTKIPRSITDARPNAVSDTIGQEALSSLCSLAAGICDVPEAWVFLIKPTPSLQTAADGEADHPSPLSLLRDAHFRERPNEIFVIEDARTDPSIDTATALDCLFYAAVPLRAPEGNALYLLCVQDQKPKQLDAAKLAALTALGQLGERLLDQQRIEKQAEKHKTTLAFELDRLDSFIDATHIGTWELNIQTKAIFFNDRWAAILGYTHEELFPIDLEQWEALIHPDDKPIADSKLQLCLEKKTDYLEHECRLRHKNGHWVWINNRGRVIQWSEDGKPLIVAGAHWDITERKLAEEKLRLKDQWFKSLVLGGADMIAVMDDKGTYKYVSPTAMDILGYDPQEVIGKNAFDFMHPDDIAQVQDHFSKLLAGEAYTPKPFRYKHQNGQWRWVENVVTDLRHDPAVQGIVTNSRDITARIQAEQQIKASEEKYRLLFNSSPLPAWIYDSESLKILDINARAVEKYGYPRESFIGMDIRDFIPPEEIPHLLKTLKAVPKNETTFNFGVFTHKKNNGELLKMEIVGHALQFQGKDCHLVVCNNVTEKEQFLEELQQSEYKLKMATDIAKLGYWTVDLQGGAITLSDEVYKLWSLEKASFEVSFDSFLATIHPEDKENFKQKVAAAVKGGKNYDFIYRIRRPSGEQKWVHSLGRLVYDREGNPKLFEGTVQDITQQKYEEQRLKLMESVVTNTSDAVSIINIDPFNEAGPRIRYVNDAFSSLTGYEPEEVLGQNPRMLLGYQPNADALTALQQCIAESKAGEITTNGHKKNGEALWVQLSFTPVADDKGGITHYIAIQRDITAQKNRELEKKLLADISMLFHRQEKLKPCLEDVLQHLADYGDFQMAELWLPNLEKTQLHCMAQYSQKTVDNATAMPVFTLEEGLPGAVWKNQERTYWDHGTNALACIPTEYAEANNIQSVIGIPLSHNKTPIGVLVLGMENTKNNLRFSEALFQQLETFIGAEVERKRLENDLHQIFTFSPDLICVAGNDGYFKKINPAGIALLEYTEEELLSQRILSFVHPDDQERTKNQQKKIYQGQQGDNFQNRYITKSGKTKWISWSATPNDEQGLVFAVAKDVTQNKELQGLLDRANNLARIGNWEVDLLQEKVHWSNIIKEIHEVPLSYVPTLESSTSFCKDTEQKERLLQLIQSANVKGEAWEMELLITTAKGNDRWIRIIGEPEFLKGECVGYYGCIQDIHKLKIAQLSLKKAFIEKTQILESIGDAFVAVDKQWTVTYWNKEAELLMDIPRETTLGKNLWSLYDNVAQYDFYHQYKKAMDTGQTISFQEHYPELKKWFDVIAYPSVNGLSIYIKDVTDRMEAAEAIRQTNERFKKVTQATNDAIWDWDLINGSVYWGKGYQYQFGIPLATFTPTLEEWKKRIHPEDYENAHGSLQAKLMDPMATKWEAEYRFLKADNTYANVMDKGLIIRDNKGTPIRIVGAMSDITYRKTYEESLQKLNVQLEKHAKELEISNAELKQFAYIASHDLQEPLRMVTSFLSLLEKKYGEQLDERAREYIYFAVDGAQRMRQIILDLLEFSRVGRLEDEKETIALQTVLDDYCILRKQLMAEKEAQIIHAPLPIISSYKAPVTQILHNLLDNALKYSAPDRPVVIKIGAEDQGDYWQFSVGDNGIGIEEAYFDKIFVIFQRLHGKDEYSGTGMGLAIVKKIIENLGGSIWLESTPNQGSTFYFTLKK